MKRKAYVESVYNDSEITEANICYDVQIVIGKRIYVSLGYPQHITKCKANKLSREIASKLGIEAKITKD